jgi:hypothetical protein
MTPHSTAFSPVGSPSGITDTSQRSCLAGMRRDYTAGTTRSYASATRLRKSWSALMWSQVGSLARRMNLKDVIAALPTTGKFLIRPQPDLMRRTMSEMEDFVSPG